MCYNIGEQDLRKDESVSPIEKRQKVTSSENSTNDLLDDSNFDDYLADANYNSDICSNSSSGNSDELSQILSNVTAKANI